jgi:Methyltransferase domain
MTTTDTLDIVQRLLTDKPSFHLGGQARWDALPGTLGAIRQFASSGDTTIETGVGASTVVFAACGANHTAISPERGEHEQVREYCERIGIDTSRITFVQGLSDDVLPSLLGRSRTLDMAFIDGEHAFPLPVIDWYYITRSLKVGGKLLMDDIPIPSAGVLFRHMRVEPNWRLEGIFDDRAAALTMLAPAQEGDWFSQPFNRRYPDLSFADLPKRLRLETEYRLREAARRAARRFPSLHYLRRRPA